MAPHEALLDQTRVPAKDETSGIKLPCGIRTSRARNASQPKDGDDPRQEAQRRISNQALSEIVADTETIGLYDTTPAEIAAALNTRE